jgi:hypothetical protein
MGGARRLSFALVFAASACGDGEGFGGPCIGALGCSKKLDYAGSGPGCSSCSGCADRFGTCADEEAACKAGRLDLGPDESGCESSLDELEAGLRFRTASPTPALVTINEHEFAPYVELETLGLDQLDPACVPTFTRPCPYAVSALKLLFTPFTFDGIEWADGTATLAGPLAAEDDGAAINLRAAPIVVGFLLSQSGDAKSVVAMGRIGARINLADGRASIVAELDGFDFGYEMSKVWFESELVAD